MAKTKKKKSTVVATSILFPELVEQTKCDKKHFKDLLAENNITASNSQINHIFSNETKTKYPFLFVKETGARNSNLLNLYGEKVFAMKLEQQSMYQDVLKYRELKRKTEDKIVKAFELRLKSKTTTDKAYQEYQKFIDDSVVPQFKKFQSSTKDLRRKLESNMNAIKDVMHSLQHVDVTINNDKHN